MTLSNCFLQPPYTPDMSLGSLAGSVRNPSVDELQLVTAHGTFSSQGPKRYSAFADMLEEVREQ